MTERKPVPIGVVIGPFSAILFAFTEASVSSGSGVPACSITSTPACRTSQSKATPVASRTRRVASVSSGPVPSPGMRVTRCAMRGPAYTPLCQPPLDSPCVPFAPMSATSDFRPGLEGVIAFETEIAEPDKDGGYASLSRRRHRGARRPLPVRERLGPARRRGHQLAAAPDGGDRAAGPERLGARRPPGRPRDTRAEVGDAEARRHRRRGRRATISPGSRLRRSRSSLRRRAEGSQPFRSRRSRKGENAAAQFLIRWRGEADPRHVKALDTYWISAAEHGLNASTFTARIAASTGADCAAAMSSAVGTLSGPLHGGAPARVLPMIDGAAGAGDPEAYVRDLLDRGERIMGFGHRVYRAYDPRARVLKRTAIELGSPRVEVAAALEEAALKVLREKSPDRQLETNVEYWAAVVLDFADIPADLTPAMFGCARVAGWSAHILEQKRTGRLIRPARATSGPAPRPVADV